MGDADVDIILCAIKDPTAVYLHQHLTRGRCQSSGSPRRDTDWHRIHLTATREGPDGAEEMAFISDIFEHAARAHEHLSEVCANVSVLAKVMDKATLLSIINGSHMTAGPAKHTRGVSQPSGR